MNNKTIIFMLSAAVAVVLVLASVAQAQTCLDCSQTELELGTCTPLTDFTGSFSGYIVRLSQGSPEFDGTNTTAEYEACLKDGFSPPALSHADLESKICNGTGCTAVAASGDLEQFAAGTGGDPSTGYGADWGSDLIKIELPGGFQNGTFYYTVAGEAWTTLGKIGFKAGQDFFVGNILLLVCSADCPLVKFASVKRSEILSEAGYLLVLETNVATECSKLIEFYDPDGNPKVINSAIIDEFFGITKDGAPYLFENVATSEEGRCETIFIEDDSLTSPSVCSGGWCWY
jgi:hypothetical protein